VSSLGLKPPTEWLEMMLVAAFEGGLTDYGPQELTNLLASLGRLRFAPEYAWMDLFWAVSFYKLGQFKPQELVCILSAAVKIGHQPPPDWLAMYLKVVGRIMLHCISAREGTQGDQHGPRSRSILSDRFSKQQRWLVEADDLGSPLDLHGYSRILTSLAALEVSPSKRWMAAFFQATKPLLHSWQGSSSSSGSSRRNDEQGSATSNDGGGESLLHSTVRRSSTLSETEHGWQSEGSLHAVIADTGGQACAEQHQPGVLLGLACARGAGAPKACELENEESSSTADAGKPGAQDGVNGPVGSLGAHKEHDHYGSPQGLLEDEEVRKRATTKSSSSLHVSSKFGLVFEGLLTGLAVLHVQPPEDWLDAFFDASLPHVPYMHHRNLDGLAYSIAALEIRPRPAWASALVDAIEQQLTQAQAQGEKVDRTSLGKSLFGIHWLEGPNSPVYQRWRDADWIGSALELYAYKRRPVGRRQRVVKH